MDILFRRTLNKLGVFDILLIKKMWRLKRELNISCKETIGNLWDFDWYLVLAICQEVKIEFIKVFFISVYKSSKNFIEEFLV